VTLNPTNYIEAGASFNVTSTVNNTGEVASGSVAYNLEKKVGSGAYSTYSTYSGTRTFPLSPNPTYITNSLSFRIPIMMQALKFVSDYQLRHVLILSQALYQAKYSYSPTLSQF